MLKYSIHFPTAALLTCFARHKLLCRAGAEVSCSRSSRGLQGSPFAIDVPRYLLAFLLRMQMRGREGVSVVWHTAHFRPYLAQVRTGHAACDWVAPLEGLFRDATQSEGQSVSGATPIVVDSTHVSKLKAAWRGFRSGLPAARFCHWILPKQSPASKYRDCR